MAKIKEKEQAIILRKKGKSISYIAKELLVSKSTVSIWCKDITLSRRQINIIAAKTKHESTKALLFAAEQKRNERIIKTAQMKKIGSEEVGKLSDRDIFMVGLGLYWGEGYKKGSQEMGFTNSDLSMIKFYIKWLRKTYSIPKTRLTLRVSINSIHKDRIHEVERYWSKHTGIQLSQFTKTSLIKIRSKKVYENKNIHYGTLRIKVQRGTNLRRQVMGSIESLALNGKLNNP